MIVNDINLLRALDESSNVDYFYYRSEPNIKIIEPFNKKNIFPIPYIKIDNFTFSIRRFYKNGERTHVIIYSCNNSTGELYRCEYYTSNSNLSFYRYCIYDSMYIKGANYVSSTFINMRLQKFINDYQELFNIPKQREKTCQNNIKGSILEMRINNDEYMSQNLFFRMMDILLCHHVAFCLQDASPERPCVGRNDIRLYRQG